MRGELILSVLVIGSLNLYIDIACSTLEKIIKINKKSILCMVCKRKFRSITHNICYSQEHNNAVIGLHMKTFFLDTKVIFGRARNTSDPRRYSVYRLYSIRDSACVWYFFLFIKKYIQTGFDEFE